MFLFVNKRRGLKLGNLETQSLPVLVLRREGLFWRMRFLLDEHSRLGRAGEKS